jgi:hypothetical protein
MKRTDHRVTPGMKGTERLQCDCGNPVRGGCGFPGCPLRSAPSPSEEPKAEAVEASALHSAAEKLP